MSRDAMKRIVAPLRWSSVNRVEQPPLMSKQLLQGVCGGLRWLEAKSLAEYVAKRAIEDGYPSTKKQRVALNAQAPAAVCSPIRKARARRKRQATLAGQTSCLTGEGKVSSSTPNPPATAESSSALALSYSFAADGLVPLTKPKRLVSYDVLDCTFGSGFHTGVVLENGKPYTRVVAMDCDMEATVRARTIVEEFGPDRFRFYACRMSEAKAMFGERAFDAVLIDPGPSLTQLEDPERGFLLDDEGDHMMDMRYGPTFGLGALEYLNTVPQHTLAGVLASYALLTPQQSMKLARAIRKGRPFGSARHVLAAVEEAGNELPEDGWMTQASRRKTPMSWKFLVSLRCIVNHEQSELREALQNALLLLRTDGRLVVFSRLPWEEKLISTTLDQHPHALLSYTEAVPMDDVQEYGHTRHTKMWVAVRTERSSYALKNSTSLSADAVQESSVRWMGGLFAGQTHGFPANNFTFENRDRKDWAAIRSNQAPPPFDADEEP